jgi:hypothetical protein
MERRIANRKVRTPAAYGIQTLYCKVHILCEEPHIYPVEFVVVEPLALRVGDECGMKVASYPYANFAIHSFSSRSWRFFATHTGDFFFSPAYEGTDYWLNR